MLLIKYFSIAARLIVMVLLKHVNEEAARYA